MNVAATTLREIVVDHQLDSLEINSTSHHIGANQAPNLSALESFDNGITLLGCSIGMDAVCVDPIEEKLSSQFLRSEYGLHEDEDRWVEGSCCDECSQGEQLVLFSADKLKRLSDCCSC